MFDNICRWLVVIMLSLLVYACASSLYNRTVIDSKCLEYTVVATGGCVTDFEHSHYCRALAENHKKERFSLTVGHPVVIGDTVKYTEVYTRGGKAYKNTTIGACGNDQLD